MDIFQDKYQPPHGSDDIDITLNIPSDELCFFSKKYSQCFFSKDEKGLPGEDVQGNIKQVWNTIGLPVPDKFTSMAARVSLSPGSDLSCYGNITFVLDKTKIASDTFIFNGDFKTIGYKLQSGCDKSIIALSRPMDHGLARKLNTMTQNARKGILPRLIGGYFEARIRRSIRLDDVQVAYVGEDMQAKEDIERILADGF